MKLLPAFQQNRRSNSFRNSSALDSSSSDGSINSPTSIFWLFLHCLCCLISLILGFRFSRLVFFLLFSTSAITNTNFYTASPFRTAADIAETLAAQTTMTFSGSLTNLESPANKTTAVSSSRVVVGRHGILIRPWPHPNPIEVMKAHKIIETVQREQRLQYGIKSPKTLIAITPTYVRTFQALHLTGLMHTFMNLPYDLIWIVVEAGGATNETAALLAKSKLHVKHIEFKEKMPVFWEARRKLEDRMRMHALRVVREENLDGIVMFADDSNTHSLELFDEMQKVQWIGAVSVGILAHSGHSDQELLEIQINADESKLSLPVQGPACNSSDQLIGWHTFNTLVYDENRANYIGDKAMVLPRRLEWAGFVLNSRLVWKEPELKPEWIKDLDVVNMDGENIESPLALLKDSSVVEPLGSCGRKVLLWWLRVEARADSKFPSGWIIDPPLEVTVPAKRTPWPDAPPKLPSNEKVITTLQENTEKHARKTRTPRLRRSSRGKRKRDSRNEDAHVTARQSGEN